MDGSNPIDSNQDVIDSRDIIARIEWFDSYDEGDMDADEVREVAMLRAVAREAQDINPEWTDGVALVADSYFVDYITERTQELNGRIYKKDARPFEQNEGVDVDWSAFPFNHIDWQAVADDEQRHHHSSIDFDGRTFWLQDA